MRKEAGVAHVDSTSEVRVVMKLMRAAVLAGVAKKLYNESRKPQNQARMKAAVEKVRERRHKR